MKCLGSLALALLLAACEIRWAVHSTSKPILRDCYYSQAAVDDAYGWEPFHNPIAPWWKAGEDRTALLCTEVTGAGVSPIGEWDDMQFQGQVTEVAEEIIR